MPTPGGVPVDTMSPGSSVITDERYSSSAGTSNTNWFVLESCKVRPFNSNRMRRLFGSGISSLETSSGPIGPNVSKVLPIVHCVVASW